MEYQILNFLFIALLTGFIFYLNEKNHKKYGIKFPKLPRTFGLISLIVSFFILKEAEDAYPFFLLSIVVFFCLYLLTISAKSISTNQYKSDDEKSANINKTHVCPNCKNPTSTNRQGICEWCGCLF